MKIEYKELPQELVSNFYTHFVMTRWVVTSIFVLIARFIFGWWVALFVLISAYVIAEAPIMIMTAVTVVKKYIEIRKGL